MPKDTDTKSEKNRSRRDRERADGGSHGGGFRILGFGVICLMLVGSGVLWGYSLFRGTPTNGANGTNGIDGASGTNGIDGTDGTDGIDALGVSYVITTNGTGFTALSGRGLPLYRGNNATIVIQSALTATNNSGGGIVQAQNGRYPLHDISVGNKTIFQGEGNATVFVPTANVSVFINTGDAGNLVTILREFCIDARGGLYQLNTGIKMYSQKGCEVDSVLVVGNATGFTLLRGIDIIGTFCIVRDCIVQFVSEVAIGISSGNGVQIISCYLEGDPNAPTQAFGVESFLASDSYIDNCLFFNFTGAAIEIAMSTRCFITSNTIKYCGNATGGSEWGAINLNILTYSIIQANILKTGAWDGLYCEGVTNCTFKANDYLSFANYAIENVAGSNCNMWNGERTGQSGVKGVSDAGNYNLWANSMFFDNWTISGANTQINCCWNGTAWYSSA